MTEEQYQEFKDKIEKEKNDFTTFNLTKEKSSIFDNCREIYTTLYLYDYLVENARELNYYKFPKKDILKDIYKFMNEHNSEVSEQNLTEILFDYNANYTSDYLIKGKLYRPIFFGEEEENWGGQDDDEDTCGDCGCRVGEQHYPSCDIERCPCCGGQFYSCACGVKYSVDLQKTEIIPLLIKEQERENKKLQRELDILYKKQNRRTKNKDAEM